MSHSMNDLSQSSSLPEQIKVQHERFVLRFKGDGAEYFGIWLGNVALTILTLGLYSPWAKVRRMKYFYRSTELAGSTFDYDAQPKRILLGRIIAITAFLIYSIFGSPDLIGIIPALTLTIIVLPVISWFYQQALRFRARYSSWRGIRFRFTGDYRSAFLVSTVFPILAVLTAGLLFPFSALRSKQYQLENSALGGTPFQYSGVLSAYVASAFRIGAFTLLLSIVVFAAVGGVLTLSSDAFKTIFASEPETRMGAETEEEVDYSAELEAGDDLSTDSAELETESPHDSQTERDEALDSMTAEEAEREMSEIMNAFGTVFAAGFILAILVFVVFWSLMRGIYQVEMHRLVFNYLAIGPYTFRSTLSLRRGLWVVFSNSFLTGITLGLFKPFAVVRLLKMKLEHIEVAGPANVTMFIASATATVGALGEEAAELLDLDFGF